MNHHCFTISPSRLKTKWRRQRLKICHYKIPSMTMSLLSEFYTKCLQNPGRYKRCVQSSKDEVKTWTASPPNNSGFQFKVSHPKKNTYSSCHFPTKSTSGIQVPATWEGIPRFMVKSLQLQGTITYPFHSEALFDVDFMDFPAETRFR